MFSKSLSVHKQKNPELVFNLNLQNQKLSEVITDLCQRGRYAQADKILEKYLYQQLNKEDTAEIYFLKGRVFFWQGKYAKAIEKYDQAIDRWFGYWLAHMAKGEAYLALNETYEAIQAYHAATRVNPEKAIGWRTLGFAYSKNMELEKGSACYLEAIKLSPKDYNNWHCQSNALQAQGRHQLALEAAERTEYVLDNFTDISKISESEHMGVRAAKMFSFISQEMDDRRLAKKLQGFGEYFKIENPERPKVPAATGRKIKIAYVGGDFFRHVATNIYKPLLLGFSPKDFEVYIFSSTPKEKRDDMTALFSEKATKFVDISEMTEDQATLAIRHFSPDIAIDISGYTTGNRLSCFARGIAPIQITGLGFVHPLNLSCFDYYFTDHSLTPVSKVGLYKEQPLFLDSVMHYANNMQDMLETDLEYPYNTSKNLVFGCTNSAYKLTDQVINVWADILNQTDGHLLLKAKQFTCPHTVQRIKVAFLKNGVPAENIVFMGFTDHFMHTQAVKTIDIMLDPFPYQGGITTCEALLKGCPVVALDAGTRTASSVLENSGLGQFVAASIPEYKAKAIDLARQVRRGTALNRAEIAKTFSNSPLCDNQAYIEDFEKVIKDLVKSRML